VLVALVSSAALPLRGGWPVIAVRVLGSWTAATGLLLVGWFVHNLP
jgi:urease accessory protein